MEETNKLQNIQNKIKLNQSTKFKNYKQFKIVCSKTKKKIIILIF